MTSSAVNGRARGHLPGCLYQSLPQELGGQVVDVQQGRQGNTLLGAMLGELAGKIEVEGLQAGQPAEELAEMYGGRSAYVFGHGVGDLRVERLVGRGSGSPAHRSIRAAGGRAFQQGT